MSKSGCVLSSIEGPLLLKLALVVVVGVVCLNVLVM